MSIVNPVTHTLEHAASANSRSIRSLVVTLTPRALVVALTAIALPSLASTDCSKFDEYAALRLVPYLTTWSNVALAHEEFRQCDDGAIAEGFSEMIVRLLVDQWPRLYELRRLTDKRSDLETFVLRHVNATLDQSDLKKLERLSRSKCTTPMQALCAKLANAARGALNDQ